MFLCRDLLLLWALTISEAKEDKLESEEEAEEVAAGAADEELELVVVVGVGEGAGVEVVAGCSEEEVVAGSMFSSAALLTTLAGWVEAGAVLVDGEGAGELESSSTALSASGLAAGEAVEAGAGESV